MISESIAPIEAVPIMKEISQKELRKIQKDQGSNEECSENNSGKMVF